MGIQTNTPNIPSLRDATVNQGTGQPKSNLKLVGVAWEVKNGALQVQLKGLEGSTISFNPQDVLRLIVFKAKNRKTDKHPSHLVYLSEDKPSV